MNIDTGRPIDEAFTLRLRGPADLLVAVPYLLGFHPTDSLVLVGVASGGGGPRIEVTLRVDLPPPRLGAQLAPGLVHALVARGCDELLVAVVGGQEPAGSGAVPGFLAALSRECAGVGVRVRDRVWAAELAEGARWRCYDECACTGVLPDPASSPLAAEVVAAGQVTFADRAQLERMVAPGDPEVLARRSVLLDRAVDEADRRGGVLPGGVEALDLVAGWVRLAADGPMALRDEDVVGLCLALAEPLVRDVALGFALGPLAVGAQRLWSALVTGAPDPEAAEPAVLLAFSELVNGNGALTGVALQRAQRAWPGHRLSAMLQDALAIGTAPAELRAWVAQAAEQALVALTARERPC